MNLEQIEKIKNAPHGFCLAKWYQVTIDLSRGYTHSCHHPQRHKIPLEELKKDPSALHNTTYKMLQRKMMLEGIRPPECSYCWNIEDMPSSHISDRFIKSTDDWAYEHLDSALSSQWDKKIVPTYLEVIFSSECNLNCSYCMADVSSSIEREMIKFGPYDVVSSRDHRDLKEAEIKGDNPYTEAFWIWFPQIVKELKYFRITGGEPLLSKNTFKVLDYLEENPAPNLQLAINTNLSYSSNQLQIFISQIKVLLAKKAIKSFTIFTSLDGFSEQASYIRKGLDLNKFMKNISLISDSLPDTSIVLMCTYNILSIGSFKDLLFWIAKLKDDNTKILLDVSYLQGPAYLSAKMATHQLKKIMNDDLMTIKSLPQFDAYEINKYERIVSSVNTHVESNETANYRSDFYIFINEYDRRFGDDFLTIFPTYRGFMETCKKSYLWKKTFFL